ncbi:hypothetical protein [Microvirga puerhi]|uniref:FHA domain-containing protein n=1 Tax=Microvirga puerhi TaxID=2876078 RepID=A0ABS7VTB6_9HYPH|nr:hypothetical protein [Microvirga puerhi]MBZ6078801.1 hypothetical protein [Microvirga puerhi]
MLQHITLHLARTRDFPEGSAFHGYEITAPLDAAGHLDQEEWRSKRAHCHVRRFWLGERDQIGLLVHRPGGAGGATWVIDYNRDRMDDDEAGYRLGTHTFLVGEYVSIRDAEGDVNTFKVVSAKPFVKDLVEP